MAIYQSVGANIAEDMRTGRKALLELLKVFKAARAGLIEAHSAVENLCATPPPQEWAKRDENVPPITWSDVGIGDR